MKVSHALTAPLKSTTPLAVLTFEDEETSLYTEVAKRAGPHAEFAGKAGTTCAVSVSLPCKRAVLVGLGPKKDLTPERIRCAAGAAATAARAFTDALALPVQGLGLRADDVAAALVQGATLGAYQYLAYKTELADVRRLERIVVLGGGKKAVADARLVAEAVCYARDLVNTPPSDFTPAHLEREARRLAKELGLKLTVFNDKELAKRRMNAILAVGKGSAVPPRMLVLEYSPKGAQEHLVFCGKGVCYDSGGYNLKTKMQELMKDDMGGAAALLGMLKVVAARGVKRKVTVVIGAVENLISGAAYKPGDVVRALNGKTIEVANTDAEGRVVLADCLSYASRLKGAALIDVATLTGAAMVALGSLAAAVCSPNADLARKVVAAGEASGDRAWELPMWEEYARDVESEIADVKNLGYSFLAGVTAGASFLKTFVADPANWLHIDMGGAVMEERPRPYVPKGATGWGVRLLSSLVTDW